MTRISGEHVAENERVVPERPETCFGLIRHATTAWNIEKRIQGQTDIPLATWGRAEAGKWRAALDVDQWDLVLTSDLVRAVETARIVSGCDIPPDHADPRLREQDWGEWTGKTLKEIRHASPDLLDAQVAAGWRFCPPRGEDRLRVRHRAIAALHTAAQRWPGRRVLVVTHEGVIKCLLYYLMQREFLPAEPGIIRPRHLHLLNIYDCKLTLAQANALDLNG